MLNMTEQNKCNRYAQDGQLKSNVVKKTEPLNQNNYPLGFFDQLWGERNT